MININEIIKTKSRWNYPPKLTIEEMKQMEYNPLLETLYDAIYTYNIGGRFTGSDVLDYLNERYFKGKLRALASFTIAKKSTRWLNFKIPKTYGFFFIGDKPTIHNIYVFSLNDIVRGCTCSDCVGVLISRIKNRKFKRFVNLNGDLDNDFNGELLKLD